MSTWWSDPKPTHAFTLSWVSAVVTLLAAIGGIIAYYNLGSSLILCYGLENFVDFFSSAIVLWRFYLPNGSDPERESFLAHREKRASVAISFILGVLGFGIIIAACEDFSRGNEGESNLWVLYYVSFFSLLIFGAMSFMKFHYARKLDSASLQKDGICSLIGTILSGSLFINTILILSTDGSLWWLDPTVAMLSGMASLGIGLYGVYEPYVVHDVPVFDPNWWIYSKGDGMDEISGRDLIADDIRTKPSTDARNVEGDVELPPAENSDLQYEQNTHEKSKQEVV